MRVIAFIPNPLPRAPYNHKGGYGQMRVKFQISEIPHCDTDGFAQLELEIEHEDQPGLMALEVE